MMRRIASWTPRVSPIRLVVRHATSLKYPHGRLCIVGSGWAGFKVLQHIDTTGREVVVVSPRNYFVLTPLLASSSVGTLDFRSISEPVRGARKGENVGFYQARVESIDAAKQQLHLVSALEDNAGERFSLDYDQLVLACGGVSNTFGLKDVEKHCFFLKDTTDARRIRQRIVECFEHAEQPTASAQEKRDLLHFAVVGGGPTGVEFAAELNDFVREDLYRLYPRLAPYVQITILEAGNTLLNAFDAKLQNYALEKYRRNGIHVRTGVAVTGVEHRKFTLSDGTTLPFGMALWSTGLGANPLLKSLDVPKGKAIGRLLVDDHLRVPSAKNIYALGDCAVIEGNELPATAQVAQQQGVYLANLLNDQAQGKPDQGPFKFRYFGKLAYVGEWRALADLPKRKERGVGAWFLWRSFYLTTAVSWKNKLLIPMYWFLTFMFGRDTSRF